MPNSVSRTKVKVSRNNGLRSDMPRLADKSAFFSSEFDAWFHF